MDSLKLEDLLLKAFEYVLMLYFFEYVKYMLIK